MLLRTKVKTDKIDRRNENFHKEVKSINKLQVDIYTFKNYSIKCTQVCLMKLRVNYTEKNTECMD